MTALRTARTRIPGMDFVDVTLPVPLHWDRPEGDCITVFAREVVDPERSGQDLPLLLFLQGGPGGKANRPNGGPVWLREALKRFRVVLMDQRGTGRSSPVTGAGMARFGTDGAAGAAHLAAFGADSIIRDAEALRAAAYGGRKWWTLGQSYGGFLTLTYLSHAPEALEGCIVTGGLPGIAATAADVYARTFPRVADKNRRFHARFPQAAAMLAEIAARIGAGRAVLPDGDLLSVRRLQVMGLDFGMAPGFENVFWVLDEALDDASDSGLSETFLTNVMGLTGFQTNPLFAALQESIYAQNGQSSGWAAEAARAKFAEFAPDARPLYLTGEMMFPWMFDEIRALRPFAPAAEALARHGFDRRLYDPARLAANEVPVAAAVYHDDMYVDAGLSLDSAARIGAVKTWVTNAYEHDGLRQDGAVFARLLDMITRQPV